MHSGLTELTMHPLAGSEMGNCPSNHNEKPSALSVANLVLSLCTLAATSIAAVLWNAIDADHINRADAAGWDETMLLPHQLELTLAVNASVLGSVVLVVIAFLSMRSRRGRSRLSYKAKNSLKTDPGPYES